MMSGKFRSRRVWIRFMLILQIIGSEVRMSRKFVFSYDDLDELYDTALEEYNRKRDRKKRQHLSKERRYKFSRRNHIQRDLYAY